MTDLQQRGQKRRREVKVKSVYSDNLEKMNQKLYQAIFYYNKGKNVM